MINLLCLRVLASTVEVSINMVGSQTLRSVLLVIDLV